MAKRKQDPIAALSGTMLDRLQSLRDQHGEAYPPRLSQLAELTGLSPTFEQVCEAVKKKAFAQKAVVSQKVGKTPSLDSPVYFKEDVPRTDPVADLARRMVAVLESQRPLGPEAYPPVLSRLVELCERKPLDKNVGKAIAHTAFVERVIPAARKGKKPAPDAPIMLKEDLSNEAAVMPTLLRFALGSGTSKSKGKILVTTAFTLEDATKRVVPELRDVVGKAFCQTQAKQPVAGEVGSVLLKGKRLFFLLENVHPSVAEGPGAGDGRGGRPTGADIPTADLPVFPQVFREAFDRLDRRNGQTNFVKLSDLREALRAFSRDEFDAGLRTLRFDGEFTLNSHEGLYGLLTAEEREGGVLEAGSLLVYASRRQNHVLGG